MERSVACLHPLAAGGEAPDVGGASDHGPDAFLGDELAGHYRLFADGRDPRRPIRYVAMARSLEIRPYAVVTDDLDELRRVVARGADVRTLPGSGRGDA
jgi:hypothetical protein